MSLFSIKPYKFASILLFLISIYATNAFATANTEIGIQINKLNNGNEMEVSEAINKLAEIGNSDDDAIFALIQVVINDKFKYTLLLRYAAIDSLGKIANSKSDAIKILCSKLVEEKVDLNFRLKAIDALDKIANLDNKEVIDALISVLKEEYPKDEIPSELLNNPEKDWAIAIEGKRIDKLKINASIVHTKAANVLVRINNYNPSITKDLVKIIENENYLEVIAPLSEIMIQIADNCKRQNDTSQLNLLIKNRDALYSFNSRYRFKPEEFKSAGPVSAYNSDPVYSKYSNPGTVFRDNLSTLDDKILALEYIGWRPYIDFYERHSGIFHIFIAFFLILQTWFLLLWVRPLWILYLNDTLSKFNVKLPDWLGGITINLSYVFLIGFFCYHSRVLDAWIEKNIWDVKKAFDEKPTVASRSNYISIGIAIKGKILPSVLKPQDFHEYYKKGQSHLIIWGDAGIGKTSLACHLSRWAMKRGTEGLCYQHRMLPILIEHDLEISTDTQKSHLLNEINNQVKNLITAEELIQEELLKQLLKTKRFLVVVDSFSEMDKLSQQEILENASKIPINAIIFTSRLKEKLNNLAPLSIQPQRIEPDNLHSFLTLYFKNHEEHSHLMKDEDIRNAWESLHKIVGEREITALLATAYAEHLLAQKLGKNDEELPTNIPDLMLTYIKQIHRNEEYTLDTVVTTAQAVAWLCLKETFSPKAIFKEEIYDVLDERKNQRVVDYLEKELNLIKSFGATNNKLRFSIDPLSEYLAGLYLIKSYKDENKWKRILQDLDRKIEKAEVSSVKGFLTALYECCLAKGEYYKIPKWLNTELKKRLDISK